MNLSPKLNTFLTEKFDSGIADTSPIGGGCINDAFRVLLQNDRQLFVKKNRLSLLDMFEKEAAGLEHLSGASDRFTIPETIGIVQDADANDAYLVLDFVEEARPSGSFDENFGRALAGLHRNSAQKFGLDYDNYIGRLPQKNSWRNDWPTFFIECRIAPQFAMARDNGYFSGSVHSSLDRLYSRVSDLFPDEPPALLHGDLWGGNYMCDRNNRPVLIDPAVFYGHREAELSFTQLFGSFGRKFYEGYQQEWPLEPGFPERKDIYNLYPLLVHVNLFGGSYVSQAESVIRRF